MFQIKRVEKTKTYMLCSITFCYDNHVVYEIRWENMLQPHRSRDNTAHVHCITKDGRTHTQTCNTYCFSTAKVVS